MVLRITGKGASKLFGKEAGIHRWQGVSKNKTHTSSITVAVLPEAQETTFELDLDEVEITATRGSGKGGQHRNKKDTCIVARHRPTGLQVRIQSERSQSHNKEQALAELTARLLKAKRSTANAQRANKRKTQVKGGKRGEKRRTVQEQNSQVIDHVSGKSTKLKRYLRGFIEDLA